MPRVLSGDFGADSEVGIDSSDPSLGSPADVSGDPPPPLSVKWVKLGETRFAPWVALALVIFGVVAEFVVRTDPPGLVGAILGVLAVVVARLAASGREGILRDDETRVNRWSRDGAAVVGIGASIGLLWRATPTLRILDLLAILVSVVLVSDVWLRASMLVMRRVVLAVIEPIARLLCRDRIGVWDSAGGVPAPTPKGRRAYGSRCAEAAK